MSLHDVLKYEFVGLDVEIVKSKNKTLEGIKGKIIDESRNTFTIKTENKTKKILKNQIKMMIKIKKNRLIIDGKLLVGRPEDRLKKK